MSFQFIMTEQTNGIAIITLNRPEKRNALHQPMILELLLAMKTYAQDQSRVLLINSMGENFCAGGDIAWMQKIATDSDDANFADAQHLADLLYTLYTFPKPTIVMGKGAVLGGGLGLLAAADIAIASKNAIFGLPEVQIGITPSIISPYVIAAIGERAAYYYFLTGERFGVEEAQQLSLIHQTTQDETLTSVAMTIAESLVKNSPQALKAIKRLIRYVAKEKINENLAQKTAEHLAHLRVTPEAQEGLRAFLEKRLPNWS